VPGDPVEVAAGFIALGRGMALLSQHGNAGRIVLTFLKAVIASAETIRAENKI
jgi:predicted methyltransferase